MSVNIISDTFILGFVTGTLFASVAWYYGIKAKWKPLPPKVK